MTGALTPHAGDVLASIAQLVGEPDGTFRDIDLADVMHGDAYLRGLRAHTLPALERRAFIVPMPVGGFRLTEAGFDEAMRLTGGRGLL